MNSMLRRLTLIVHIVFSVGWIGAVAGFLTLSIIGLSSRDAEVVRGAYVAMSQLAWFVIVPMSLAALATGLIQALGTEWGLFRYYWVMAKLFLTILATIILLMKMPLIDYAANAAAGMSLPSASLRLVGMQLLVHAAGGILILVAITAISVFKPWGKTPYDIRPMQNEPTEAMTVGLLTPQIRTAAVIGLLLTGFILLHLLVFHLVGNGFNIHDH